VRGAVDGSCSMALIRSISLLVSSAATGRRHGGVDGDSKNVDRDV
jgi:hypothetical protein